MKNLPIFFFLGILLIVSLIWFEIDSFRKLPQKQTEKVVSQSGQAGSFKTLLEQQKKEKAEKKAEEEKKFITSFGPCKWIPIFMYHHVDNKPGWLYVDKDTFVSQMDYLVGKGYTTITLPEVVNGLVNGGLPPKPVVLTFDDGYRDVFDNAYPVLRERNLKATIFLITQLMEGSEYLTWEQVREMVGSGLITVGDHTLSHRSLVSLSEKQIKDEIFSSKNILEQQLKTTVNVFSFPYGSSNEIAIKYLKEAGFVAAVTSQSGLSCAKLPFGLRRIRIGRASLADYGL